MSLSETIANGPVHPPTFPPPMNSFTPDGYYETDPVLTDFLAKNNYSLTGVSIHRRPSEDEYSTNKKAMLRPGDSEKVRFSKNLIFRYFMSYTRFFYTMTFYIVLDGHTSSRCIPIESLIRTSSQTTQFPFIQSTKRVSFQNTIKIRIHSTTNIFIQLIFFTKTTHVWKTKARKQWVSLRSYTKRICTEVTSKCIWVRTLFKF